MLFAFICTDKPDSAEIRQKFREGHMANMKGLGTALKFAGPFLNDAGAPCGSLFVIDTPDRNAAQQIANRDPYCQNLFSSVDIRPWKWAINNPEAPA